ncbi:MAG TPA: TIGR01459 family HAD-type hydrolase [Alphaproteobacteria bacterium]|nr:TIGR01459 family HAD-type hydrolase [Alphaproteobacteria bacterium]HAJ46037.1 TIGR01459 family HAD-type hydrolase [Alphaproteobacteria bacterium]
MPQTSLVYGLSELAPRYDALVSDVWGVIHNGVQAYPGASDALRQFRNMGKPVVLLTNAPRPQSVVAKQLHHFGIADDAYDAIVTSGDLTRAEIARRAAENGGPLPSLYIGPDRDLGIFDEEMVVRTDLDAAQVIICTGPYKDDEETPDDYRDMLERAAARGLAMICANPDLVVQRGERIIYCAGSLAALYEQLGGMVWYAGKPHLPVYGRVDEELARAAGRAIPRMRVLMAGDGLKTDVLGANRAGLPVLLITGGIHTADFGHSVEEPDPDRIRAQLARAGLNAVAACPRLRW